MRKVLKGECCLFTGRLKQRYERKILELKRKTEKIKVAFLVQENAKWNGDALFRKMSASGVFDPVILVSPLFGSAERERNENLAFFSERGYQAYAINNTELESHKPDMVFYQQPWGMTGPLSPGAVSKYALCFYLPYSIATAIDNQSIFNKCKDFFQSLTAHFVFNTDVQKQYESLGIFNTVPTGHPKLDAYGESVKRDFWIRKGKNKIIYAPHHSFEKSSLLWATFQWNGKKMLEIARNNSDTEWIFKPHPRFKHALKSNQIMTDAEVEDYYNGWSQIGQIYDQGDYFDLFRTSDCLITDCGSFLTEYLPTGNPVIYLVSSETNATPRNVIHEKSSQHYYKVRDAASLDEVFQMLVKDAKDPLMELRNRDAAGITLNGTANVFNYLITLVEKGSK